MEALLGLYVGLWGNPVTNIVSLSEAMVVFFG
jgi:hypothetical protein